MIRLVPMDGSKSLHKLRAIITVFAVRQHFSSAEMPHRRCQLHPGLSTLTPCCGKRVSLCGVHPINSYIHSADMAGTGAMEQPATATCELRVSPNSSTVADVALAFMSTMAPVMPAVPPQSSWLDEPFACVSSMQHQAG